SMHGINLTRIESRPTKEALGRYCFYLDCEGHIEDRRVGSALKDLYRLCLRIRFLGSYPQADYDAPVKPDSGPGDEGFRSRGGLDRATA
ncbi:MAG: hypothetical protein ACRDPW_05215, partial [Mycobacteriales bacterium]